PLPVDFAANARSLGAHVIEAKDIVSLQAAQAEARQQTQTTVIVIETDREQRVGGYESWWDVPIAEVSDLASTQAARAQYVEQKKKERHFIHD
ncbi:MAG: thiamine pyrophosphate enzyme domain protein TPP-binding, partial [Anaerolineales bacterium]|nr:thiamine pyrophosphate enzyme domain protein TPP-binding [Anaerolineales bacterium]